MTRSGALRLGTRASALARAQARLVADRLRAEGREVELVEIRTGGDRPQRDRSLPLARGAFVKELEAALLDRRIDLAVHSAKDLPTEETPGLVLAAVPPRGDPRDALVTRHRGGLADLPAKARVGTESPRRRAFLLLERPDLRVVSIRGNVDTRLERLEAGRCDALVLAKAGLDRLGETGRIAEVLEPERMLPAVGQGALVVQARSGEPWLDELACLEDPETRHAVAAERAFLKAMGGGCRAPFAALARLEAGDLVVRGAALDPDGREVVRDTTRGPLERAVDLGRSLAGTLLERGAAALAAGGVA
ncbi:MAG: hydroxymethylbilane synthase [Gemmatimonadota bacterium]